MSWLQPMKKGLHFILSDNCNYDFDVKFKHCRFVSFVSDVIDIGIWDVYFILRQKRKTHVISTFILQYSSKGSLSLSLSLSLHQLNNYIGYVCNL